MAMIRTTTEIPSSGAQDHARKECTTQTVIATANSSPPRPWAVRESLNYKGRFFFYNSATGECAWVLPRWETADCSETLTEETREHGRPGTPLKTLGEAEATRRETQKTKSTSIDASVDSLYRRGSCLSADFDAVEGDQGRNTTIRPGDIEVVGGLGSGGFAVVVEVEALNPACADLENSHFAMKCMSKSRYTTTKSRKRLAREINMLTTMEPSPFLLRGHLAFETPSAVFLVTDLLTGGDLYFQLDQVVGQGRDSFQEAQARTILAELSLGLVHLHCRGFVHMDLKIENVMFDGRGHVKIVDFGLARKIPEDTDECDGFAVDSLGSLIYMAPELLTNLGGRFTDWWALGILAYEMLTGCSPWSSMTDQPKIKRDIVKLEIHAPLGVSAAAGEFVLGLLQKDRRARLGTRCDDDVLLSDFFEDVDWGATEMGRSEPALTLQKGVTCVEVEEAGASLQIYEKLATAGDFPSKAVEMGLEYADKAPDVRSRK